jgi:uncharacterized membrane protein YeaQ/YmgE (transglycosylase-associated protein family)
MDLGQIIVWLVIGALAGSLPGWVVKRDKKGFGAAGNVIVGLIGAVIGGVLFDAFGITIGSELTITLGDVVAAFVGSLILLVALD